MTALIWRLGAALNDRTAKICVSLTISPKSLQDLFLFNGLFKQYTTHILLFSLKHACLITFPGLRNNNQPVSQDLRPLRHPKGDQSFT